MPSASTLVSWTLILLAYQFDPIASVTPSPSTGGPTEGPTIEPAETLNPTNDPTAFPSHDPTASPTTPDPTDDPTTSPSDDPSTSPTKDPTVSPTPDPTRATSSPSQSPTRDSWDVEYSVTVTADGDVDGVTVETSPSTQVSNVWVKEDGLDQAWAIAMTLDGDGMTFEKDKDDTISIEMNGACTTDECDFIIGFGDNSSYFTMVIAQDKRVGTYNGDNSDNGTVHFYPSSGLRDGDLTSLLDDVDNSSVMAYTLALWDATAGGYGGNFLQLSTVKTWNEWPMTLTVTNNVTDGVTNIALENGDRTVTKVANLHFEEGSDLYFTFTNGVSGVGEGFIMDSFVITYDVEQDYTDSPTKEPTYDPTTTPTIPTADPSTAPNREPTADPTVSPTNVPTDEPTASPTVGEVSCGEDGEGTFNGDWEYWIYIDTDSMVTFDTCSRYVNLFSLELYNVTNSGNNLLYECPKCGSICLEGYKFTVELAAGTYFLTVDQKHKFHMQCSEIVDPTKEPTPAPIPTASPTAVPSPDPTTGHPTQADIVVNVSFTTDILAVPFMSDPYGRFEAAVTIDVVDESEVLGAIKTCPGCFVWQYRVSGETKWSEFDHQNNPDISMAITEASDGGYTSKLVMQSVRRMNSGHCVDPMEGALHLFEEDTDYELRMRFLAEAEGIYIAETSNTHNFTTNGLPYGGECIIQNQADLLPLQSYNLFCAGWQTASGSLADLEFNALINDVPISTNGYVQDSRSLTSIAPVGAVEIVVLVKELNEYNAISCVPIIAEFTSVTDLTPGAVDDLLVTISNITNGTSLSDNPDVAVCVHSVIEEMYVSDLTTQAEAAEVVTDMVGNILGGSTVVNPNDDDSGTASGDDIITELATMNTITSNADIVVINTTTVLVDVYLTEVFTAVDLYIDNASSGNSSEVQDALYNIGETSQAFISNLEATLTVENVSNLTSTEIDSVNSLSASLVDYATYAATTALAQSEVGESFNYEVVEYDVDGNIASSKTVEAVKFEADNSTAPSCGDAELPETFTSDEEGVFDCAFMSSTTNNFISVDPDQADQESTSVVTVNLYGSVGRRRRRLSEAIEYNSTRCFPYKISMEVENASKWDLYEMVLNVRDEDGNLKSNTTSAFPQCTFWDTNSSTWAGEGCYVYDIVGDTLTCGCTHLTTFSISGQAVFPEANVLTELDWKNLTVDNLLTYPTVWVTCFVIFIVFLVLCIVNPRSGDVRNKSIIAYQDSIYKSFLTERLNKDVLGKEIKYYGDSGLPIQAIGYGVKRIVQDKRNRTPLFKLQWALFKVYLRNGHSLLAVFQRTAGTNYSVRERLGCFFMYICTIMVATGMFYGIAQSSPLQDVVASFITSLIGTTPSFLVSIMFVWTGPGVVPMTMRPKKKKAQMVTSGSMSRSSTESFTGSFEADQTTRSEVSRGSKSGTRDDLDDVEEQMKQLEEMRKHFYEYNFPFPPITRKIGWVILVLWSCAAVIVAVVYGLSFDLEPTEEVNTDNANYELYENGCWNNSLQLRIENELSVGYFGDEFQAAQEANSASYGGSDSGSWLLALGQSLLLSMLLWQPINVYILTWISVWMFSWHIEILMPWNLPSLCKRCCCGPEKEEDDTDEDLSEEESQRKSRLARQNSVRKTANPQLLDLANSLRAKSVRNIGIIPPEGDLSGIGSGTGTGGGRRGGVLPASPSSGTSGPPMLRRDSSKRAAIVAHPERPPDMMMFWGNDDFLIDDTKLEMEPIGDVDGATAGNKLRQNNFRADSFRDPTGKVTETPEHVMHIHAGSGSEDLEMQQVDVTWTRNGQQEPDVVYDGKQRARVGTMSLGVPGDGMNGMQGIENRFGSVEDELAASMDAYDPDGKRKRKVKKKMPPIEHSTEWAY